METCRDVMFRSALDGVGKVSRILSGGPNVHANAHRAVLASWNLSWTILCAPRLRRSSTMGLMSFFTPMRVVNHRMC